LQTAPWTQQTAVISETDKTSIRTGLATETNVNAVKTNTNLIPALL
jgi:flagellar basal body rod protein FlgG